MSYKFSKRSIKNLETCSGSIQDLLNEAIKYYDFTVLCGFRDKKAQNDAYEKGYSKLRFPHSRHNKYPSNAVDVVPYPIDWDDTKRFLELNRIIMKCADELDIKIDWGFNLWGWDMPHYQLSK